MVYSYLFLFAEANLFTVIM